MTIFAAYEASAPALKSTPCWLCDSNYKTIISMSITEESISTLTCKQSHIRTFVYRFVRMPFNSISQRSQLPCSRKC